MSRVLQDLEEILIQSRELLAAPDPDFEQLQEWSARRATVFARLQEAGAQVAEDQRPGAVRLIEEILKQDAALAAMLERRLGDLGGQIAAVGSLRRVLDRNPLSQPPALIQRFA